MKTAVVALVALASACGKPSTSARGGPAPSASAAAVPALEIENPRHAFGSVTVGARLQASFETHNGGTAPLVISGAVETLGCSGRAEPGTLSPNGRGRLHVECRPQVPGPFAVSLRINSNDARVHEIALSAQVAPRYGFEKPFLSLNVPVGQERSEEVALIGELASKAEPHIVEPASGPCRSELLPATGDGNARLRVSCRGASVGLTSFAVAIRTGLDEPSQISLPCSLDVAGTLRVTPTNPYFNLRLPGVKALPVEVRSERDDFEVTRVDVVEGPFSANLQRKAPRVFEVLVQVDESRLERDNRGAIGVLRIHSNDPGEPTKDVPLSAFGKLNAAQPAQ
ncbi:MAG: DUF1573 domain-containing protein [Myxococcota bacterium]